MQRSDGRRQDEVRPLRVVYDMYEYASGSVLYEIGKTKVLCAVSLQPGVPRFLRGCKTGWLTAHYAMLPTSTPKRIEREINLGKKNGRYVEISRLIGRSLRSVLQLDAIPDRTINIDCDILQADGGTRTACITAAYMALKQAEQRWFANGTIEQPLVKHDVAAISVGVLNGVPVLDPNFAEDNTADGDFNFVITRSGSFIEVQGTAEKAPLSPDILYEMYALAAQGVKQLFVSLEDKKQPTKQKQGLFTLSKRLKSASQNSESL